MIKSLLVILLSLSSATHAARFVVESRNNIDTTKIKLANAKIERFYPGRIKEFNQHFIVSGKITESELKKLSWVKSVESTFELSHFSLTHPDNAKRLVSDELFPYQWGLLNQEQTYYKEKDDIHNMPLKGIQLKDIGWEKFYKNTSTKRPIVAVLDSGIDLNHPEFKNNIWSNEGECGKDPSIDNDGNKLAGDCQGWNFTESIDSDLAKSAQDFDGHGTHVAGIIAAAQNGVGIVGVAPNALIMPIKVMRDSNSSSDIASSESFARGILYAVDNGAQVINMSLGWPRSLETKYLRDAVFMAVSRGVVIVAAAGNNNSSDPLFPCAYEGVVCVAASTLDGSFAGFSNYGAHVDTVAPGEGILSLNPTMYEPQYFAVPGYDIRSGTSQASPFVAGLIATLLNNEDNVSLDSIFARIYQSQNNTDTSKYVLGGDATWDALSKKVSTSVIRPIHKKVRQVLLRVGDGDNKLSIPIKNFGLNSKAFKVRIQSLSKSIEFNSKVFAFKSLASGETIDIEVPVENYELNGEAHISFQVIITENNQESLYINEIPVVRDIRTDAQFKKMAFKFSDRPLPVGLFRNGVVAPTISTVDSYLPSGAHEFFMKRTLKGQNDEGESLEMTLFRRRNNEFVQVPNLIIIPNALSLVNFIRVDLNRDGAEDYLVQTISEVDGKKYFDFLFYDSNLKPLWKELPSAKLTLDIALGGINDLAFIKYDHPSLGKMLVPAFFTIGQIPKIDQVMNNHHRYDAAKKNRLYFLEPFEGAFRIRALTTNIWEEQIKKDLKTKWFATVQAEQLPPPTDADKKSGDLRLIISVGLGLQREIFISSFNTKSTLRAAKLPQLVLQTEEIDSVLSVTKSGLVVDGEAFFNIYDRTRAKLVTTKDGVQESEYVYRHDVETDIVAGHIATFKKGTDKFSVIQTREKLVSLHTSHGNVSISERPKMRYSFLSQKLLSEMYYPVLYKRDDQVSPGLYVDSTSLTLNRIYLFEEQQGELVLSIRNSLLVPSNCRAMNPHFSRDLGTYEFMFLCLENKEWAMRSFEMN